MLTNELDRNARLNSLRTTYAGASVEIWGGTGTVPTDVNTAPGAGNVVLNTLTLPNPAFAVAATSQIATSAAITDPSNENTGQPKFVRLIATGGARRQLTARMAAAANNGEEVVINIDGNAAATGLSTGQSLNLTLTFTQP